MISIADIKVGVVTLEESSSEFEALQGLALYGVTRENVEIKHIPSAAKAPLTALFFAEYTDVDCVYVAMPEGLEAVRERLSELELQCRMPIGTSLLGLEEMSDMLRMVQLQSTMVARAEMEQREGSNFHLN